MGFSFRKSKSFGPFRITASRRGLSASAGAGGARVNRSTTGRRSKSFGFKGLSWRKSRG